MVTGRRLPCRKDPLQTMKVITSLMLKLSESSIKIEMNLARKTDQSMMREGKALAMIASFIPQLILMKAT